MTARILMLCLLLSLCGSAVAQDGVLQVDVPAQVTSAHGFEVTVQGPVGEAAEVRLYLVEMSPGQAPVLSGTVQGTLVDGHVVLPGVVLSGHGLARLMAEARVGSHSLIGVSAPIALDVPTGTPSVAVSPSLIPNQLSFVPFQVVLKAQDSSGAPLVGATVSLRLDPSYGVKRVLGFRGNTLLADASGQFVDHLDATTDAHGDAQVWIRLANNITPFNVRLVPSVTWQGQTTTGPATNVFKVLSTDND